MELIEYVGIVGFLLDTAGKLLVSYAALMVHHRVRHEHDIDEAVFSAMRKEDVYARIGILLIVVGASMELAALLEIGKMFS